MWQELRITGADPDFAEDFACRQVNHIKQGLPRLGFERKPSADPNSSRKLNASSRQSSATMDAGSRDGFPNGQPGSFMRWTLARPSLRSANLLTGTVSPSDSEKTYCSFRPTF